MNCCYMYINIFFQGSICDRNLGAARASLNMFFGFFWVLCRRFRPGFNQKERLKQTYHPAYYIHCQISNFLAQLHQRTSHLWHRDSNQRGLEQLGREGCSKMLNALGLWGLTKAWYRKMIQKQKQDPLLWRNSGCFNESCGEFPTRSFTSYLRCVQTDIRCDWLFREDLQKLKEWDLAS